MTNKRIFKTKKTGEFVMIQNSFFDVTYLSLKAKALLCSLLSRPSNWQVRISHLVKCSTDGRHSVESGLTELTKNGYIHREKLRNEKGEFIDTAYYIFEDPSLNPYWDEKNQVSADTPTSSAGNSSKKDSNDKNTNSKSQGVAWAELKNDLNGEITIPNDGTKVDDDIIHRLNFEDEKPDLEGLKKIADLFKDSKLNKYIKNGGRQ